MIMAENTVLEDMDIGKVERQAGYFKAKVLTGHKMEGTDRTLQKTMDNDDSIVFTDKSTSYVNIADYVDIHISEKSNGQTTKETLKWVHIAISNAKRNFVGTYITRSRPNIYSFILMSSFISSTDRWDISLKKMSAHIKEPKKRILIHRIPRSYSPIL